MSGRTTQRGYRPSPPTTHPVSKTLALVTFLAVVFGIVAASSPTGNAVIAFFDLTGAASGDVWTVVAAFAGSLTLVAYGLEKGSLEGWGQG